MKASHTRAEVQLAMFRAQVQTALSLVEAAKKSNNPDISDDHLERAIKWLEEGIDQSECADLSEYIDNLRADISLAISDHLSNDDRRFAAELAIDAFEGRCTKCP
jgi:hypothetical protein